MSGFLSGPHAAFVWGAYGVALVVLAGLVVLSVLARRRVRRELGERGLERRR
jgi:heme exporter protein CcmD